MPHIRGGILKGHKIGISELLQSAVITLTIHTDAAGLKFWKEDHNRHIQKGPDVLIISTADCKLDFKTTFVPGSEAGVLCCIIAGKLTTIKGMDLSPDKRFTLSNILTMRNTVLNEAKPATEKYEKILQPFIEAKSQWEKASSAFQEEFKKSNDPLVVIRFLEKNPFALRSIWVPREVDRWRYEKRYDLLKKVFSRQKGHSKDEYVEQLRDFLLVVEVDKMVGEGFTKEHAFEKSTRFMGVHRSINAVRKAYYRCNKQMYQKFFLDTPESYICEIRNSKIIIPDHNGKDYAFFLGNAILTLTK